MGFPPYIKVAAAPTRRKDASVDDRPEIRAVCKLLLCVDAENEKKRQNGSIPA
jgi:hypothetical protein